MISVSAGSYRLLAISGNPAASFGNQKTRKVSGFLQRLKIHGPQV
jgi:hypothetical protein